MVISAVTGPSETSSYQVGVLATPEIGSSLGFFQEADVVALDLPGEGGGLLLGGVEDLAAGVDDKLLPVFLVLPGVPPAPLVEVQLVGLGDVERNVELEPGGLLVGEVDGPLDLGHAPFALLEFPDDLPRLVVAVDPETGGLLDDLP